MIGLEWHNRKRSENGRFAHRFNLEKNGSPADQLHIRCSTDLAKRIKAAAREQEMEIGAFCVDVLESYLQYLDREKLKV